MQGKKAKRLFQSELENEDLMGVYLESTSTGV